MKLITKRKKSFTLNTIYNEDCFDTMSKMESSNVKCDLVLTSPPYNTGRVTQTELGRKTYQGKYDVHVDNMTQSEYLDWTVKLFESFDKVLSTNGVILYNMSYGSDITVNTSSVGLMWLTIAEIINKTPFTVIDRIIWKKGSALPNNTSPNKLTRIVEDVFVIVRKDEVKTFNANKQVKSVRKDRPTQVYYENVFNFIEAKNNDGSCPYNKATYSSDLCCKLLSIYAKEDSIVYDPFMGTGTTAVACKQMSLKYIGSEISSNQCDWSEDRLEKCL